MKLFIKAMSTVAACLILAGCSSGQGSLTTADNRVEGTETAEAYPSPSYDFSPVILASRESVGGLCANGVCDGVLVVLTTGEWTYSNPEGTEHGKITPAELEAVKKGIKTTEMDNAPDFTDTCPTAYDGTEYIYSWDNGQGMTITVSSCDKVILPSDPLVKALDAVPVPLG